MIRYQLPTFVKHVLAPRDDFGMQKNLVNEHKKVGFGQTLSPFGKFSHVLPFLVLTASLTQICAFLSCGY